MIESIIIKNKKGEQIELSLDELEELKGDLDKLETVQTYPYPAYYPTFPKETPYPFWQIPPVTCTDGAQ